jgi:ABC-2 type transport system permease protein
MTAIRSEFLKATTTRLLFWYGLALAAFVTFVVSVHVGTADAIDLMTHSDQRGLLTVSGLAAVTAVLVGALLLTNEYNHGTINQTFLAVPNRARVLFAKLVLAALVGAALALLADAATLLVAELWYGGRGVTLHLGNGTLTPLIGTIAASALAAGIGTGLGAIIRRQTATIVLVFLWLLIGEAVIGISPDAARYAPGHVIAAVVSAHDQGSSGALAFGAAVLAALAYVGCLCIVGFLTVLGSDAPSHGE